MGTFGWAVLAMFAGCTGADPVDDPVGGSDTDASLPASDTASPTDTGADPTPDPTQAGRDAKFDAAAEALLIELDANLAQGVSIAVMEQGTFTWVEGFGTSVPGSDVPLTPDTMLQIGSTTKQMTAALALQQVDRGLIQLDDPLSTLLPTLSLSSDPSWTSDATLHQVLSHQGGLNDMLDWSGSADDAELSGWHHGVWSQQGWPMSPAGTFWNYSNPNFTLAGLVSEVADPAGRPYADQLAEELFAPLGMTSTTCRKADVEALDRFALSTGYDPAKSLLPAHDVPMDAITDPASVRPAGMVWSTPSDMCRWGAFVLDGDPAVLSDPSRVALTTSHVPLGYYGDHAGYGYGMFVWDLYPMSDGTWAPIEVWEHGGNTNSFTSVLWVLPEHGVVISLLSSGYGDGWTQTMEAVLRAVVNPWPEASDYAGEPFDLTDIAGHAGSYADRAFGPIEITEGGLYGLQVAMPWLEAYGYPVTPDLAPASTDVWVAYIAGLEFDLFFARDPVDGTTQYVRNRSFVGTRLPDGPMSAAPLPLPMAPPPLPLRATLPRVATPLIGR